MASTYTSILRLELMADGDQQGTWGQTTNKNLQLVIEAAIAGNTTVSVTAANQALTANNGVTDQARCAVLNLTTTTGANFAVYAPPTTKAYTVYNASAYTATIYNSTSLGNTVAAGTGIAIPPGAIVPVLTNGVSFAPAITYTPTLSLGAALPVTSGGTGQTSLSSVTVGTANALNTANAYTAIQYTSNAAASAPTTGAGSFAYKATGSFGGGYALVDGIYNIGMWSIAGTLNLGFGTSLGALTSRATLDASGNFAVAGSVTGTTGSFSGAVTAATQSAGDNSTNVATTSFVRSAAIANGHSWSGNLAGGSRFINTTYTNGSGHPMFINLVCSLPGTGNYAVLSDPVSGRSYGQFGGVAGIGLSIYAMVPAGGQYNLQSTGPASLSQWYEFA